MQNYRDFDAVIDPLFSPVLGFAIESPEVGIVPESDDLEVFPRGSSGPQKPHNYGLFRLPWPRERSRRRPRKWLPSGIPPNHCTASLDVTGYVDFDVSGSACSRKHIPHSSVRTNPPNYAFVSIPVRYREQINRCPSSL